jgi:hypothetical protein
MPIRECPESKPLYNPVTNRCVTDNALNRKKDGLIDTRKKKTPEKRKNKTVKQKKTTCPPEKPLLNKVTNRCVKDNALNRKKGLVDTRMVDVDKTPDTVKRTQLEKVKLPKNKECPKSKPLYNPLTNRCVTDNVSNRKKLGLLPKTTRKIKPVTLMTPSLPKKTLNRDSLRRMIPVKLTQKTFTNIWQGSGIKQLMGLYYLYKKHGSFMCFVPEIVDTPSKNARFTTNGFMFTSFKNSSRASYFKYKEQIGSREKLVWRKTYDNDTLEMNVHRSLDLKKLITKCKSEKKRFFVGYIIMEQILFDDSGRYSNKSSAHANSFIYDTKLETLEIFEPHGELNSDYNKRYGPERNLLLKKYFKLYNANVKEMISSADFCPRRRGPQLYDNYSSKKYNNANGGYCAAWSIFYLDMRLKYPNEKRDVLMEKILQTFSTFTKEYINKYASDIIKTTINDLPNVKKYMSDKKRLKRFMSGSEYSIEKQNDEKVIAGEIFHALQGCK